MDKLSKYSPEAKKRIAAGISLGVGLILLVLFFLIHFDGWFKAGQSSAFQEFSHFYKTLLTGSQSFFSK